MTGRDTPLNAEIKALEDACLGAGLIIDSQNGNPGENPEGGESDPLMNIVMEVLKLRGESTGQEEEHHEALDQLWTTIEDRLPLPEGSFETLAQRGADLGEKLRQPPDFDNANGELLPLAETESGRTIWAVNAEGWDEDVFKQDNVTLGMGPNGEIQPVEVGDQSGENTDND